MVNMFHFHINSVLKIPQKLHLRESRFQIFSGFIPSPLDYLEPDKQIFCLTHFRPRSNMPSITRSQTT